MGSLGGVGSIGGVGSLGVNPASGDSSLGADVLLNSSREPSSAKASTTPIARNLCALGSPVQRGTSLFAFNAAKTANNLFTLDNSFLTANMLLKQ
jgi:hypothetical protein